MAVVELNNDNFEAEVIKAKIPVVIDFYADWCGPCQAMKPLFEKVSDNFTGKVKFAKLNVDQGQDIAVEYGVMSIPNLIVFKEGKAIDSLVGLLDEDTLSSKLTELIK